MLLLMAFVGILILLLIVAVSLAYLALPRGRMCPHCGGATNPVVLRRLLRILSPWVQWRWCSRCNWEGPGRRGPHLGPLDPPPEPEPGFQWRDPNVEDVPIFYWRSDDPDDGGEAPPNHLPGLRWQSSKEPTGPAGPKPPGYSPGYYPPPSEELKPPKYQWREGLRGPPRSRPRSGGRRPPPPPRPWYLSWLVSKNAPGFEWRHRED